MRANTDWFHTSKWGVFCHYLGATPSSGGGAELSADAWNAQVDAFDVQGLTDQLVRAGAPYFFMTLGQNSGHYCSPNEVYDSYVGISPSKCSKRDLMMDLADAFEPHGIELMAYLPAGAPAADPVAVEKLKWAWGYVGPWPGHHSGERTGDRLAEFQTMWEGIIRHWSKRFGKRVRGWWIDGCYFVDEMYRHDDAPNFQSFAAALKAGNPDSLVCFNGGVESRVTSLTPHEDYTAGEVADALPLGASRDVDGAQYHVLSYLGESWCAGEPRFPDALATGYTQHVTRQGGVVTWDVPISPGGLIPEPFVNQLQAIGEAVHQ